MEVQFDFNGAPTGGRITNYLLEKSRVIKQAPDERSKTKQSITKIKNFTN